MILTDGYTGEQLTYVAQKDISEDMKQVTVLASTERRDIPIIVEVKDISAAE